MPSIYGAVDLLRNELRNAVVQNLGSAPSTPLKGQLYFNSADNTLYWFDGTVWVAAKATAAVAMSNTATTLVVGGSAAGGASPDASRGDHAHGLAGWGVSAAETVFGTAKTDGSATTFARSDHGHGNPAHDAAAHSAISLSSLAVPTGALNLNNQKIINLADPTTGTDAANKQYVDNAVAGLSWKEAARVGTTANVALSGTQTIDGVAVVAGNRVLAKNQTTASQNGIYVVAAGAWARATDADSATDIEGMAVFVEEGTLLADTAWVCTANAPITLDTTPLPFVQFAGGGAVTAGQGLTQTGNTIDVGAGVGITVAADSVAVDTAVIATRAYVDTAVTSVTRKYAQVLAGTGSPETVTHNLNTRDVMLTVVNSASPWQSVEVDWEATTVNSATVRYVPNLGAGFRAVVVG